MARYFTRDTFDFLQDLEIHNERPWFETNKSRFEESVREPMLRLIGDLEAPLHATVSKHLVCDTRKQGGSMFRIHRDVRFSKDKSPYKTYVGAQLRHEHARDVHAPGLYLHLEAGNAFFAGGIWMPDKEPLATIRAAIAGKPKPWVKVRDATSGSGWSMESETLQRAPKGYPADHPMVDDLRRKSFIAHRPLTERELTGTKLLETLVARSAELTPFMRWLCDVLAVPF